MSILVMSAGIPVEYMLDGATKPELHGREIRQGEEGARGFGRRPEQPAERARVDQAERLDAARPEETLDRALLILEKDAPHVAAELGFVVALADHGRQRLTHGPAKHVLAAL